MSDFEKVNEALAEFSDLSVDGMADLIQNARDALSQIRSQNQALQEENEQLKAELAERSRIIDTLHLRSMSNTIQDADALQERIEEATALLKMEREWAGCFCFVEGGVDHAPDCTWAAWLERYERFLSPTQETEG